MKWLVTSAAIKRLRAAISNLASAVTELISGAYGPVTPTSPRQRPVGQSISALIARRAQRRCNRDHKAASIYEARHTILARGLK